MKTIKSISILLLASLLLCSCSKKPDEKPDAVGTITEQDPNQKEEDSSPNTDSDSSEKDSTKEDTPSGQDEKNPEPSKEESGRETTSDGNEVSYPSDDLLAGAGVTSTAAKNDYSAMTLEEFFDSAAFVGDSVMYGFDLYTGRNQTMESSSTFLTITSFAARHALSDVGPKSYHPSYNGQKMKVEDALALDGAKAAFIFLGLNDVRVTPNSYYENYIEFMGRIREKNPNIDIFILSTTYPVESPGSMDKATAASYRDQLQDLNVRLKAWCDEGNGYFINVVSPLLNDKGFLDNSYSSDNYVHLTNSAYAVWASTIENYIGTLIENGSAPQTPFIEFTKDNTAAEEAGSGENTAPETPSAPDETPPEPNAADNGENAENTENNEITTPEEV